LQDIQLLLELLNADRLLRIEISIGDELAQSAVPSLFEIVWDEPDSARFASYAAAGR
jgi:hypothetical protein